MRISLIRFAVTMGPFLAAAGEIRVKTFPDYRLHIANDRYQGEWQIRLPEVVSSHEGVFLTSVRPSLDWSTSPEGVYSYTWTSTPAYAKRAIDTMGPRQRMASGIEVSTKASVLANRIDLEITLRNPTGRTIHDAWIDGGCLTHMTERFFDDDHSRTFIFTRDGLTPLSTLDRTIAIRTKYFVHPAWFDEDNSYEFFWGRSSAIPTEALIVSKPVTGRGAVAIAFYDRRAACPHARRGPL